MAELVLCLVSAPSKLTMGSFFLLPDRESTADHGAAEPDGAATGGNFLSLLVDVGGVASCGGTCLVTAEVETQCWQRRPESIMCGMECGIYSQGWALICSQFHSSYSEGG